MGNTTDEQAIEEKREKNEIIHKPTPTQTSMAETDAASAWLKLEQDDNANFEEKTLEERKNYIKELLVNSDFASVAPEMQAIFIAATKNLKLSGKELKPDSEWGLSTEDAERCLTDIVRTEKFRQALKETIKQGDTVVEANVNTGDTVVEAGAGTGILAMMAAASGARKVYAIEINPQTVTSCRTFLEFCGFDSNVIEVIETDATKCDLPETVDVIISENMYTGLFEEPQMQVMNNLRRFLKPNGKIIPETFKSSIEFIEAQDLDVDSGARNELFAKTSSASTKAEFDLVDFGNDYQLDRHSVVLLKAKSDTTINAVNISSVINLTQNVRIESNTCDFLGQDEIIKLKKPINIVAGEIYEVKLQYKAGAKAKDVYIDIVPAKKLRLNEAVSEDVLKKETEFENLLNTSFKEISSILQKMEKEDKDTPIQEVIGLLIDTTNTINEAKQAGLFELFQLTKFYEQIEELYKQLKSIKGETFEENDPLIKKLEVTIEKEKKNREIEKIFYDAMESIHNLNPDNTNLDLEKIQTEVPDCAKKLKKCADILFDFEVGGIFRIDEFYSYVQKLQIYHTTLQKFIIGQKMEMDSEFNTLIKDLGNTLEKHAENLQGVPELLAGKADIMSFDEYNQLAIEMTTLFNEYLQARKNVPEATINKKEVHGNLEKYVNCNFATATDGQRFMIEFRGKKGCEFGRCANCCFADKTATHHKVKPTHIKKQFESALQDYDLTVLPDNPDSPTWADEQKNDLYKIDILTPGSFLNNNEMPSEARTEIFKKISTLPFTAIMFESRIEYLDESEIKRLQKLLRPNQKLQIAIGLESANPLVREVAINKGYTLSDFEKATEMLIRNGVDIQIYSIVKPALLTEGQAIEDSVNTAKYLSQLAEQIKIKTGNTDNEIILKLEQAFIQDGGFLDFLHRQGKYETPWTLTTAEIVRQLCEAGIDKKINIQVGTDCDYPPPETVAQNRQSDGTLCESTITMNDALQQFNVDHNKEKLDQAIEEIKTKYPGTVSTWEKLIQRKPIIPKLTPNR